MKKLHAIKLKMFPKNFAIFLVLFLTNRRIAHSKIVAVDRLNRTETFEDRQLKAMDSIKGAIVIADPSDGCTSISEPPSSNLSFAVNWFVLISEGGCSTYQKITEADRAGYSAAVIYLGGTFLEFLSKDLNYIYSFLYPPIFANITVVVIERLSAERIIKKFLFSFDAESRLSINPDEPFDIHGLVNIVVVLCIVFFCSMLVSVIIRCITKRSRLQNRLTTSHLKLLKTVKYKQGDSYDTCAICLEDYKENEKLRILPCAHDYHCKCIDPWLLNNQKTCPICKQNIKLPSSHDDDVSPESRTEHTPLLGGTSRRQLSHGTFSLGPSDSNNLRSSEYIVHQCSNGATTRDAFTNANNETPHEEKQMVIKSSFSAPAILTCIHTDHITSSPEQGTSHSEPDVVISNVTGDFVSQEFDDASRNDRSTNCKEHKNFKQYIV